MTTPKDPTFRSYSATAAQAYARSRGPYPLELYDVIFARHAQTGGHFGQLLDVGCGPGNAGRDLALAFDRATGCDPGEEMIATARQLDGTTKTGEAMQWRVATAEECAEGSGLEEGSVDLLTAAMAAHWFDMPLFWKQAARLVKPGGSVAIFARAQHHCHPDTPNGEAVRELLYGFEKGELAPYFTPGNKLCREFYVDLPLPWQAEDGGVPEFPEAKFERRVWNLDGALDGPDGRDFFGGSQTITFEVFEKVMGTAGLVTRWREDHPEDVGTERDIVKRMGKTLIDAGVPTELKLGSGYVLLFFKRQ